MNIRLPEEVKYIIGTLEDSGYEAYAVGGCVRDSMLGREPKDWDVCTSARPGQIIKCFEGHDVIETGLRHGTVTLMLNHNPFEITSYRVDGVYSDNRRPDKVEFTGSLKEDLSRRDYTVNAMAYNPKEGIVDFFNGTNDLNNKIIRCVGDSDRRFQEDALRIMRALRFASVLGFSIEEGTSAAIHGNRKLLRNIAAERVSAELNGLIVGENAGDVMLEYTPVMEEIIPEIKAADGFMQNNPHHYLDVWRHTLVSVANAPAETVLRLTMLLHDMAKPECYSEKNGTGHFYGHPQAGSDMARDILTRLKYGNDTIEVVSELILYHDDDIQTERKNIKKWLNRIGEERLRQLIEVKKADASAKAVYYRQDKINKMNEALVLLDEIIARKQCFSLRDLAVNGTDLIDAGIPEGIDVGVILNRLLEMVIDELVENSREGLLKAAKDLKNSQDTRSNA